MKTALSHRQLEVASASAAEAANLSSESMVACSASCSGLELENLNLNLLCNTRNRRSDSDYVRVAVGPCQVGPDRGDRDQRPCRSRMARAYHVIGPPA